MNQDGAILYTLNVREGKLIYEGGKKRPAWNAAMDKTQLKDGLWANMAEGSQGNTVDGQIWLILTE